MLKHRKGTCIWTSKCANLEVKSSSIRSMLKPPVAECPESCRGFQFSARLWHAQLDKRIRGKGFRRVHSSWAAQVELAGNVSGVSSKRVVLQTLHVDQSDDVKVTRSRDQDADLRHDGVNGHSLHARAQKGSHSAINARKPEPRRAEVNVRFPTIITSVAFCNQIWESTNEIGVTRSRFLRTSACLSSNLNCSRVGHEMMVNQSTRDSNDLVLLETTSCHLSESG